MSFGTTRCIGIVRTMAIFEHLICLKICVMRCFGVVRTIPTSSSWCSLDRCLSSTRNEDDIVVLLATLIIAYKNNLTFMRLYFTLWIGYYSGRKTTAIQLYLADLHCECRTEHSILH